MILHFYSFLFIPSLNQLLSQHRIQRPGRGRGSKKHEIYVDAFGGHLFYNLFVQGWGDHGPLGTPPGSATVSLFWSKILAQHSTECVHLLTDLFDSRCHLDPLTLISDGSRISQSSTSPRGGDTNLLFGQNFLKTA